VDLGGAHRIARISAGFLSFADFGVRHPASVRLLASADGRRWMSLAMSPVSATGEAIYEAGTRDINARYVRIAPERQGWLLMDEVVVLGVPAPEPERPIPGIALITDAAEAYDAGVDRLQNLLDGMGLPYDLLAPASLPSADLTRYQLAIVAPSASGRFTLDVGMERTLVRAAHDGVNLLWIGYGIWGSFSTLDLADAFGIRYMEHRSATELGVAEAPYRDLSGTPGRLMVQKESISKVEATQANVIGRYFDSSGRETNLPFITEYRVREHAGLAVFVSLPLLEWWKHTHAPDTYARAEVLYGQILRLTEGGIVGKHAVLDAKAGAFTIRLEDYTPGGSEMGREERTWLIRMHNLVETVRKYNLPLNIALVSRYSHPFRSEHYDWSSNDPEIAILRNEAQRAFASGGSLVVHGYDHQNGEEADDFSGDDNEMWDEDANQFLPLAEQKSITDRAYAEVTDKWHSAPKIWETPHYISNEDTYKAAAESGFVYVNESDTKIFPNRQGYLGRIGGHLLNIPETGFDFPDEPADIKSSGFMKQQHILPSILRLRGHFNLFYHNENYQQEKALLNLLETVERLDLWKPNLEELATFWEQRAHAKVTSNYNRSGGRIVTEVKDAFPGLALSVRLPDGTLPKTVDINGQRVEAGTRQIGDISLVEPVLTSSGTHQVVVHYTPTDYTREAGAEH
jgi:hypothetical protein